MVDLSSSRANAHMLVERFIETGEQPDFMEFLCFKNFFVEAEFYAYGAEYVVNHFQVYACIKHSVESIIDSSIGKLNKVVDFYCPCDGKDVIAEAKKYNLDFKMIDGKLHFIKVEPITLEVTEREKLEVEYDKYGYRAKNTSKMAN